MPVGIDRVKFLDGEKPKYKWAAKGGKAHWYGLDTALALLHELDRFPAIHVLNELERAFLLLRARGNDQREPA